MASIVVTFTGLCIFTFEGDPKKPKACVHLVKTSHGHNSGRHHKPLLSVRHADVAKAIQVHDSDRLAPDPSGVSIFTRPLSGDYSFHVKNAPPLRVRWRAKALPPVPEAMPFEYVVSLRSLLPKPGGDQGLNKTKIAARIELTAGELVPGRFAFEPDGSHTIWEFKKKSGSPQLPVGRWEAGCGRHCEGWSPEVRDLVKEACQR